MTNDTVDILVRLSDRVGKIVTFTFDYFFPTTDPPTVVTITEVDGEKEVVAAIADERPNVVLIVTLASLFLDSVL